MTAETFEKAKDIQEQIQHYQALLDDIRNSNPINTTEDYLKQTVIYANTLIKRIEELNKDLINIVLHNGRR